MDKLRRFLSHHREAQRLLARLVGVADSTVRSWLGGHRRVDAEVALRIETATYGHVSRADLRPDLFGDALADQVKAADLDTSAVADDTEVQT